MFQPIALLPSFHFAFRDITIAPRDYWHFSCIIRGVQALLFDLDGTLIDSFPLWVAANLQALRVRGIVMDEQTFLTDYYQQGLHHHGILEKCGLPMEGAAQFYRERNALYTDYLRQDIEWMDDAGSVLQQCATKAPLGLMTGTTQRDIAAIDERLHLSALFREIVTFDDTRDRMKPDPYGLLLLAEKLQRDPQDCVYIGDQYVDVLASHAAGMPCWILHTPRTPDIAVQAADRVIERIRDISVKDLS